MKSVSTSLPSSLCGLLLVVSIVNAPDALGAVGDTRLCNDGSTSLYFATVGEYEGLMSSSAMVQGLVEVAPNRCADLVPSGMNKVILAFFQKDSRGILTNSRITPKNTTSVNTKIRTVCVNMTQSYRLFGTLSNIRTTYVNATCPDGFSPANPAWVHQPGDSSTDYHIEIHADSAAVPWRDKSGNQYTSAPVLTVSPLNSAGPLIQANESSIRDRKAALAVLEAAREWKEDADRRAQERQAQIWAEQQRRRAAHEQRVDEAKSALTKPTDGSCDRYAEPERFKSGKDISLSGVRLGMTLDKAHEALVCHGFSINPEAIARAGGVERFWANAREKTFNKTLPDGSVVLTDVEARPPRGAPPGADFVVLSVRIRYQLAETLDAAGWERVRSEFKDRFRPGKRRVENQVVIHMQYQDGVGTRLLQLNADDYRNGSLSRYSVSII